MTQYTKDQIDAMIAKLQSVAGAITTDQFERFEFDPERLMGNYFTISYKPVGYWTNTISITGQCRMFGDQSGKWNISVSNSSGGVNTHETSEGYLSATRNFIAALIDAANVVETLLTMQDELSAISLHFRTELLRQREEAEAAQKVKVDADPALGEKRAKQMLKDLVDVVRVSTSGVKYRLVISARGTDRTTTILCAKTSGGSIAFYLGRVANASCRWSRTEVLDALATSSTRSCVEYGE